MAAGKSEAAWKFPFNLGRADPTEQARVEAVVVRFLLHNWQGSICLRVLHARFKLDPSDDRKTAGKVGVGGKLGFQGLSFVSVGNPLLSGWVLALLVFCSRGFGGACGSA